MIIINILIEKSAKDIEDYKTYLILAILTL